MLNIYKFGLWKIDKLVFNKGWLIICLKNMHLNCCRLLGIMFYLGRYGPNKTQVSFTHRSRTPTTQKPFFSVSQVNIQRTHLWSLSLKENKTIISTTYIHMYIHKSTSCAIQFLKNARILSIALCTIFMILLTLWNSEQKNGLLIKLFCLSSDFDETW